MSDWTSCDGWHRRDLADGTYLMVSRNIHGIWQWRRHDLARGELLASAVAPTAQAAVHDAVRKLGLYIGPVAA